MTDLPFAHPDRTASQFRPFKAWSHFRKLVADKEDTEQVFHIVNALRGKSFYREARSFFDGEAGRKVLEQNEYLPDLLDNHDWLKAMPAGSLGQAYVRFMEKEGLTAAGLVAEYDSFRDQFEKFDDQLEIYSNRLRDTHDLFHVLTGYGRDALGEAALLGFSYSQNKNLGILFIAYAGAREQKKVDPTGAPFIRAVREGQRHGQLAKKIAHQDLITMLPEPLEEVRKKLNILPPKTYERAHEIMRAGGVDPYDILGTEQVAAA